MNLGGQKNIQYLSSRNGLHLILTITFMIAGMTIFELIKHYIVPNITIWQSHIITIIFATIVGTIAGLITLSKIQSLYLIALTEIERRKNLQSEIAMISEREKRLLGETLHDGLGQQLTGISYMLQTLSQKCSKDDIFISEKFDKISDLITNSTNLTRNIAKGIYPVELREHDLDVGFEELASNTKNIFNISCDVKCDKNISEKYINIDMARQLYLLTQEAINNAIKHGKANKISIELSRHKNFLILEIHDNGFGFEEKETTKGGGIGFAIMEHRAELLNGKLSITGKKGKGTIVSCRINISALK